MNNHRTETKGSVEFLQQLKAKWDISQTFMNQSDSTIMILYEKGRGSLMAVAQYNLITKQGVVYDRRTALREN